MRRFAALSIIALLQPTAAYAVPTPSHPLEESLMFASYAQHLMMAPIGLVSTLEVDTKVGCRKLAKETRKDKEKAILGLASAPADPERLTESSAVKIRELKLRLACRK